MQSSFDFRYWEERYAHHQTGWDIGYPSPALVHYFDSLAPSTRLLLPGAGNGYEAEYLFEKGFRDVFVLDIARRPLLDFQKRNPGFPQDHLIRADFFEYKGTYDVIVEQAFFCAIDPSLRERYVEHMAQLLPQGGRLIGLLWATEMNRDEPPFGGSREEYERLFSPLFHIREMEITPYSIKPRMGREFFVNFEKK